MTDAIQQLQSLHQTLSTSTDERLPLLAAQSPLPALTLRSADNCAYRFSYDGEQLAIASVAANDGILIDPEDWLGLTCDMEAVPPLVYGNRLQCAAGELNKLLAW